MKRLTLFLLSLCFAVVTVDAQDSNVQLVEQSGTNAVFYVTVPYTKKQKDLQQSAQQTVFKAIMYNGLEGFNGGKPLIQHNTAYVSDFLNPDKMKYTVFVKGIYHEGGEDVKKINNHIVVVINYNSLMNTLKRTGTITT